MPDSKIDALETLALKQAEASGRLAEVMKLMVAQVSALMLINGSLLAHLNDTIDRDSIREIALSATRDVPESAMVASAIVEMTGGLASQPQALTTLN